MFPKLADRLSATSLIVCLSFAIAGCSGEPKKESALVDPSSPSLPAFKFRGLTVGKTTIEEATKAGTVHDCSPVKNLVVCKFSRAELDGMPLNGMASFVDFKEGRFSSFVMTFEPTKFPQLSVVVASVYGKMCDHPSREFNVTSVWCFDSGLLMVERPGVLLDNTVSLSFSPDKTTAEDEPRYTRDTI